MRMKYSNYTYISFFHSTFVWIHGKCSPEDGFHGILIEIEFKSNMSTRQFTEILPFEHKDIAELYHSIAQSRYQLKDYNSARQDRNNRDDSKSSDICKAFASIHEYQDDFGSATSNYIRAIEIGEE
ncbi:unnamed protein product [Rotaria magnacalcarata]|uniref:Uncharacterized protein n=2 Tax=Rotaria magnacalcarata TaxID=392030 RepID=A0A815QTG2_9BILA|nr:unnamed protein product [Rotaria magnacalcarata]